jgi:ribosome maturation factor RimP
MTARTPQRQQLVELIGPVITAAGYDLDDLSVTAAGRRSLIRISVDGDHGIDLDAVADVSRAISDVLDSESGGATFAGPYVLEVSSPGVDRPLTEVRHWRRAVGRLVTVAAGEEQLTGRILSADDHEVALEIAGQQRSLKLADLGPGRVQVEFSRPGEPEPQADTDSADTDSADDDDDDDDDDFEEDDEFEPDDFEQDDIGRGADHSQNHKEEA